MVLVKGTDNTYFNIFVTILGIEFIQVVGDS